MTVTEQILLSIVTTLFTALITYFGFWRQAKAQLMKEFASRFNEKKWEVYIKYVQLFPKMSELAYLVRKDYTLLVEEEQISKAHLIDEIERTINELESEILLIGSDNVVYKFKTWKIYKYQFPEEDTSLSKIRIDLVNSMREDLGNVNSKIDLVTLERISQEFDKGNYY